MKITVAQPTYFAGEKPNKSILQFIKGRMADLEENQLIVFPEYSNVGGLSKKEELLSEMVNAKEVLDFAAQRAKAYSAYVAINVLEERDGELKNSTYLFNREGKVAFVYDKIHLPPAELKMGVSSGIGECCCQVDNIKFAFMTCYDVYFNEQIERIADYKPDIIVVCAYQRAEREDIIRAQSKLIAFRTNAYVVRSSYSMGNSTHGGCSMIVAPDGRILQDIGGEEGTVSQTVDPLWKYTRSAGFGEGLVRNDDFISSGRKMQPLN